MRWLTYIYLYLVDVVPSARFHQRYETSQVFTLVAHIYIPANDANCVYLYQLHDAVEVRHILPTR